MLEGAGHQVVGEASDRREALNLTRALRPEIAVLDIPSLDGLVAAREIRRIAPDTKVILPTVQTDKTDVLRGLGAGAKGYILKSQAAEDLIPAIREASRGSPRCRYAAVVSRRRIFELFSGAADRRQVFNYESVV